MSKADFARFGKRLRGRNGFLRNEGGTVAIEFAILAPVMIILMIGVVDLGSLLMKYRHSVQAASSLAQVGAYHSIMNRDSSQGVENTITEDQAKLIGNGLKMVLGENDAEKTNILARRVIRNGSNLKTDWTYRKGDGEFPLNTKEILSQIAPGESLMVVDLSFSHQFIFTSFFGKESRISAHYTAGVPSY